ncbi:hypothetical protein LCGC14_0517010 [marine sediment metagenome]|uniref:Lin1244/Lin1753-like N-terminal domain-containing protein n=1 Tax=marine sediment metagenome TaxID=412755 RepID=A0A0F9SI23_9ZZZZ
MRNGAVQVESLSNRGGVGALFTCSPPSLSIRDRDLKWFKHLTDSHDDPFIQELIEQHGYAGYYVFFATLEIYAREYKANMDPNIPFVLDLTWAYVTAKLGFKHPKQRAQLKTILNSISKKWSISFNHDRITITIDKFNQLLDEYTIRKIRLAQQKSGHSSDPLTPKAPDTLRNISPTEEEERIKRKDLSVPDTIGEWTVEKASLERTAGNLTHSEYLHILENLKPEPPPWEEKEGIDE